MLDAWSRIARQRASAGSTGSGPQSAIAAMCLEMRSASRSSPACAGVRESALVQIDGFDPGSGQHPEEAKGVGGVAMISGLLEGGHQGLEVAAELGVLAFAPRLDPNGHEAELRSALA